MQSDQLARAACDGTMSELWFGFDGDDDEPRDQLQWRHRRAGEICAECPVRLVCLADELTRATDDQHGFRGGMSAAARRALIRRWRKAGKVSTWPLPSQRVIQSLLRVGTTDEQDAASVRKRA